MKAAAAAVKQGKWVPQGEPAWMASYYQYDADIFENEKTAGQYYADAGIIKALLDAGGSVPKGWGGSCVFEVPSQVALRKSIRDFWALLTT